MRAIAIIDAEDLKILQSTECPIPSPAAGEVLIKVAAAGVNRPDVIQRKGHYPPPPGASDILGLEIAGTIAEVGDHVETIKPGDKVCALLTGGGYAEYCLASADLCLPIPDGLSLTEAAALPETFFTVWSNVFDRAKLQPGETLLVHGGTSGIGTTAIQLAKAFDASVFVTAGSDAKCRFCLELGADAAIHYKQQDFVEAVNELTHKKGVDVILDMIGGPYFPRNLKCLSNDGRLVQIAIQQGAKADINLWTVMSKRLTVTGSTLRAMPDGFKRDVAANLRRHVWPLLSSGKIKPVIHTTFPLTQADQAHALMESSRHIGKIILTV
ncbi:MAG: NAD(P)H-quinone oxidoreductase [Gammaproteobacteria bacterium]